MSRRIYPYVGSSEIVRNLPNQSHRVQVTKSDDVMAWINSTNQQPEYDDLYFVTFIVDLDGDLWINDRRSEHVLCAKGDPVLSAGEIGFSIENDSLAVVEITNQSTGYCPEPESWDVVHNALKRANISHPDDFTNRIIFRLCKACNTKNIIKDDWYVCAVCDEPLSNLWNFS